MLPVQLMILLNLSSFCLYFSRPLLFPLFDLLALLSFNYVCTCKEEKKNSFEQTLAIHLSQLFKGWIKLFMG